MPMFFEAFNGTEDKLLTLEQQRHYTVLHPSTLAN